MGYSIGSAVADLIDNSISAKARNVDIRFSPLDEPFIAIRDDGEGMSAVQLDEAMRHGSKSPLELRLDDDLGRFGLGLKTASLSQCKRLTVVTLKDSELTARAWDVDLVNERKKWVLLCLDNEEAGKLPSVDALKREGHGTVVVWEKLDRLLAGESDPETALGRKVDEAREHLSLVFHRYLSAELGLRQLAIAINGIAIAGFDPFLTENSLTQKLQDDSFEVEGKKIRVKPYILPHPSRLSPKDVATAGGQEGLRRMQGFYVYRQKRLIIWGTWFRLARKEELSRLARVRVDIPNSLDHLWVLDIRKSIAHPPEAVRQNLRRTIERIREQSRDTHVNRGHRERNTKVVHAWTRVFSAGTVAYEVNTEHVAISSLRESLSLPDRRRLDAVFQVLETSFPVESLYVDVASEYRVRRQEEETSEELRSLATALIEGLDKGSATRKTLLSSLPGLEPFCVHPELAKVIARELMND
jgi:hypothetical protein